MAAGEITPQVLHILCARLRHVAGTQWGRRTATAPRRMTATAGGLAVYPPKAFAGDMHLISIKPDASGEYRNLAENPADQRGEVEAYPHATANVETRNESGFAALIPSAPRKAARRRRAPYFTSAVSLTTK